MATGDITVKTIFTPNISFAPAGGGDTPGLNVGKLFKPAVYVETAGGGQAVLYAPYGEPGASYFYLMLGALVFLFVYLVYRRGR